MPVSPFRAGVVGEAHEDQLAIVSRRRLSRFRARHIYQVPQVTASGAPITPVRRSPQLRDTLCQLVRPTEARAMGL